MDVNISGRAVRLGGARSLSDYPRPYQANYFVSDPTIKGARFLSVCPRGRVRVSQLVKVVEALESGEGMPRPILCDELTPTQRRDLTPRGVAWYFSEKTFRILFRRPRMRPATGRRRSALAPWYSEFACTSLTARGVA